MKAVCFLLLLVACGKKADDQKTAEPAPAPSPSPAAKPGPAPTPAKVTESPKPAPAESPNGKQCKELLAKSWQAAQPGFAKLKVAVDAALETAYTTNENYLKACAALSTDKLECLAKADNPIAGIDTCKVNEGAAQSMSLYGVESKIGVFPAAPLSKEDADKILAELEGTWVNEWKALKQTTTWTIGKGGAVTKAEVVKDGKPDDKANVPDQLSLEAPNRLKAHWKGSSTSQTLSFFKTGKEFYAATNSLYDAYRIPDQKNFVVRYDWNYIAYDNGKCEAINANGLVVPATCSFAKDGGNNVFRAEWQFPRDRGKHKSEHVIVGDHFVHKSMFEIARFKRK